MEHTGKHVPADTNGGWGVASAVIVLTVALALTAGYIHNKTYKHPTDVTMHAKGEVP